MDQFYVVILSILSMLVFSIIFYVPAGKRRPPPPPGPSGLPIVGYFPFLGDNLLHDFNNLSKKHGPIFTLRLGQKPYTVISSPSLAGEVLRQNDAVFGNRDTPVAVSVATYGGLDVAWAPLGPEWRAARRIFVHEMMSCRSSGELREEGRLLVGRLRREASGTPVEIGGLCFAAELRVLMRMSWGATVAGEAGERVAAEVRAAVSEIMEVIGKTNVSDYYPFLAWLDVQGIRREMERRMARLDKILDVVFEEYEKKLFAGDEIGGERRDFLQILEGIFREGEAEGKTIISQKQIRAMLMDVVAGGTDTSATTEWAMAELMNNPEVMAKAQKELHDVVGGTHIVEEFHVPRLKYLEAVIKETLRLHPPVPLLIPRSPSKTSTIGGYTIQKETGVFINIWSIQRDPTIWDNPLEFKPERFLDGKWDQSRNQFLYLPFGLGRRICAGQALGEKIMLYLLASLVHSFEWTLPQGVNLDMSETYGLVLRKSTPLVIIPSPRSNDSSFYT